MALELDPDPDLDRDQLGDGAALISSLLLAIVFAGTNSVLVAAFLGIAVLAGLRLLSSDLRAFLEANSREYYLLIGALATVAIVGLLAEAV